MVFLNVLSEGKTDARGLVVNVLAKDWPLSARQIYLKVAKEHPLTYQGVHKALKQLEQQGVLKRTGNAYQLNLAWVSGLKSFAEKVEDKYLDRPRLDFGEITDSSSVTLKFTSLVEALYAVLDQLYLDYKANPESDVSVAHWRHTWPIICTDEAYYRKIAFVMSNGKHYALCRGNSPFDRFLMDLWKKFGKKYVMGVDCAEDYDLMVSRDKIVQIFVSPKLNHGMDAFFKKKVVDEQLLSEFYKQVYMVKDEVTLVITRNQGLADQIRAETLKYFGK